MAAIERPDGTCIHYETHGEGPVVLALAPGVVNSDAAAWAGSAIDVPATLPGECTVVRMDQRYAGQSTGPNIPFTYEAMIGDQIAVLDAVGVETAVIVGAGIGANYALRLACLHPERVTAAVLIGPLGRKTGEPRNHAYGLFEETCRVARADGTQGVVEAARANPQFDENPAAGPFGQRLRDDERFMEETLRKGRERYIVRVVRFRDGMFPADTPFYSVSEDDVRGCAAPMLVVPGDDALHPPEVGEAIAGLAKQARLLPGGAEARSGVLDFVVEHSG